MLQTILNLLGKFGNVMDLPGSSVRDLITGNNPFDQWLTPTEDVNRVSGRDVLSQFGLMRPNHETGMSGWLSDPGEGLRDIGGAVFEGLLDPTNLLPANWVGKVLKSRKATAAANAAIGGKYGYVNPKVAARPAAEVVSEVASSPMKLLGYTPEPELVYHGGHKWTNVSDTHPYGRPIIDSGKTGEGAQAFGPGVYFAQDPSVTDRYYRMAQNKVYENPELHKSVLKPGTVVPHPRGDFPVLSYDSDSGMVTLRDIYGGPGATIEAPATHLMRDDWLQGLLGPGFKKDYVRRYGLTSPPMDRLINHDDENFINWAVNELPDHPNVTKLKERIEGDKVHLRKMNERLDELNRSDNPDWDLIEQLNESVNILDGDIEEAMMDYERFFSGSGGGEIARVTGVAPFAAKVSDIQKLIDIGVPGSKNTSSASPGTFNMNIWDQNVLDQMKVREINGEKVPWSLMLPIQQKPSVRVMPAPESPLTPTMAQKQVPLSLRSPLAAGFMYNMLARQRGEL